MITTMNRRSVAITMRASIHVGSLVVPEGASAITIFAHGSGSSRLSQRNLFVADALNSRGIATLLFDLLTETEDRVYQNRFDMALLTQRLLQATQWVKEQRKLRDFAMGYFGASTGAAAALKAAAGLGAGIGAVVSRGGRPDLAGADLARVQAPTLLIVGGNNEVVIGLNKAALAQIKAIKKLEIVPGATHLFEEPGTLEEVARLATHWFERFLVGVVTA